MPVAFHNQQARNSVIRNSVLTHELGFSGWKSQLSRYARIKVGLYE